jgi:hypothetical protein
MRKLLVASILAFFLIPNIVGNVVLAQRGRQGDELGRVATGLCCLDACVVPDFGPVGNTILMVIGVAFIIFLIWGAIYEENRKQKVVEDTKSYENWVHRTVSLVSDPEFRGVVVHQEYDKLYINHVNQYGSLVQITRKISEVNHVKTKEASNGAEAETEN